MRSEPPAAPAPAPAPPPAPPPVAAGKGGDVAIVGGDGEPDRVDPAADVAADDGARVVVKAWSDC
jgi:hypothetical protein